MDTHTRTHTHAHTLTHNTHTSLTFIAHSFVLSSCADQCRKASLNHLHHSLICPGVLCRSMPQSMRASTQVTPNGCLIPRLACVCVHVMIVICLCVFYMFVCVSAYSAGTGTTTLHVKPQLYSQCTHMHTHLLTCARIHTHTQPHAHINTHRGLGRSVWQQRHPPQKEGRHLGPRD